MTWCYFNSQPDPRDGYKFTRIIIESGNANVVQIATCRHPNVLYSVPTLGIPIFRIRFDLYDLTVNKMTGLSVTYGPDNAGGGMTVNHPDGSNYIEYNNVPSNPAGYGPINVRLRFAAPNDEASRGWLDLDVDFSYPPTPAPGPGQYAWQAALLYPRFGFNKEAVAGYDNDTRKDSRKLGDYNLLSPAGELGKVGGLGNFLHRMVVQFAALYKTGQAQPKDYAQGVALKATDVLGHNKDVLFEV